MKKLLSNEYNVLTIRVFLGALLVFASIDKISDPEAFARSILDYRILSGGIVTLLATVIPWMEMLCGMAMIFGVVLSGSALTAGTLLIFFTGALLSALFRGLDISCGCFTQDPTAAKIGWMKIGENLLLIGASAFLYFSKSTRFSLEQYLRGYSPKE